MLIGYINKDSVDWDPDSEPSSFLGGIRVVRGSNIAFPHDRIPLSMRDALFDPRVEFDAVRKSLLEFQGGDLQRFAETLEYLQPLLGGLGHTFPFQEFQTAVLDVIRGGHTAIVEPDCFLERVWPLYLNALEHGHDGLQYWLSYDELLALATIARVPLVVFDAIQHELRQCGSNLRDVRASDFGVVLCARVNGCHFERLVLEEDRCKVVEVRRNALRLTGIDTTVSLKWSKVGRHPISNSYVISVRDRFYFFACTPSGGSNSLLNSLRGCLDGVGFSLIVNYAELRQRLQRQCNKRCSDLCGSRCEPMCTMLSEDAALHIRHLPAALDLIASCSQGGPKNFNTSTFTVIVVDLAREGIAQICKSAGSPERELIICRDETGLFRSAVPYRTSVKDMAWLPW